MSKIVEYHKDKKEECLKILESLCDMAITTGEFTIWHTAVTYANGLGNAFECYLDKDIVKTIEEMVDNKCRQFMDKIAKEEMN